MSQDEFLKQQFLTLREEIRDSKARIFQLLLVGTILVPLLIFAADQFKSNFASVVIPFVVLVIMVAFVIEQHTIIRAGRYLKEHVEPHVQGALGWEHWLESNRRLREMDRIFFGSLILVFLVFYAASTAAALNRLSEVAYNSYAYAGIGYGIGGVWFLAVLLRHWSSFTTTLDDQVPSPAARGEQAASSGEPGSSKH